MSDTIQIGQRVFAKVRGHSPWPGRIENVVEQSSKNKKYLVYFYGTHENAVCTGDNVFKYEEYKTIYGKPRRRRAFNLALIEIENADEHKTDFINPTRVQNNRCENPKQTEITNAMPKHENELLQPDSKGSSDSRPGSSQSKTLSCTRNDTPQPLTDIDYLRTKGDCKDEATTRYPRRKCKMLPDGETFEHKRKSELRVKSKKVKRLKESKSNIKKRNSSTRNSAKKRKNNKSAEKIVKNSFVQEDELKIDKIYSHYESNSMLTDELESYKTQTIMLEIEHQLRSNLFKREPNVTTALNALYELRNLEIKPLMLKKHPQIVWTLNKLITFNESNYLMNLTSFEVSEFNFKAFEIRKVSEMILGKYMTLFTIPDDCTFWNFFAREILKFKNLTENMTVHEVCTLRTDPSYSVEDGDVDTKWNDNCDGPSSHFKECVPESVFNCIKEEKIDLEYLSFCGNGSQEVKSENSEENAVNHFKEEIFAIIKTEQNSDEFESEENWLQYV